MKVNGRKVALAKVNATNIRKLAEMGAAPNWDGAPTQTEALRFAVGMLALSWDCTAPEAAEQIRQHIKSGGNISPFIEACSRAACKRAEKWR